MSLNKAALVAVLSPPLPSDIVTHMIEEYVAIKHHLAFRRFRPSELSGGRFAECAVRLLQHIHAGNPTPFSKGLDGGAAKTIHDQIQNNTALNDSMRLFVPKVVMVLMDLRNRRDVGHVGGDVNPNLSDSLMVGRMADWVLTEVVRTYYKGDINEAQKITDSLNEIVVPVVAEIDGFVRIQNTSLGWNAKTLVILYYKNPEKVRDTDLFKWTEHKHVTRYKGDVLGKLHSDALIHYAAGTCELLPKGVIYVEKHIPMDLIV